MREGVGKCSANDIGHNINLSDRRLTIFAAPRLGPTNFSTREKGGSGPFDHPSYLLWNRHGQKPYGIRIVVRFYMNISVRNMPPHPSNTFT